MPDAQKPPAPYEEPVEATSPPIDPVPAKRKAEMRTGMILMWIVLGAIILAGAINSFQWLFYAKFDVTWVSDDSSGTVLDITNQNSFPVYDVSPIATTSWLGHHNGFQEKPEVQTRQLPWSIQGGYNELLPGDTVRCSIQGPGKDRMDFHGIEFRKSPAGDIDDRSRISESFR